MQEPCECYLLKKLSSAGKEKMKCYLLVRSPMSTLHMAFNPHLMTLASLAVTQLLICFKFLTPGVLLEIEFCCSMK